MSDELKTTNKKNTKAWEGNTSPRTVGDRDDRSADGTTKKIKHEPVTATPNS
jgi:hypothetical protein